MRFRFIHLISFRFDNARVFQRFSMNLNMTIGQATCRLLCRYTQSKFAAFCVCWIVPIVTCKSDERTCGCFVFEMHLIKGYIADKRYVEG